MGLFDFPERSVLSASGFQRSLLAFRYLSPELAAPRREIPVSAAAKGVGSQVKGDATNARKPPVPA